MNRRQLKRLRKSLLAIYDELDDAYRSAYTENMLYGKLDAANWSAYTENMLYEATTKLGEQIERLDKSIHKMEKEDGDNGTLSGT